MRKRLRHDINNFFARALANIKKFLPEYSRRPNIANEKRRTPHAPKILNGLTNTKAATSMAPVFSSHLGNAACRDVKRGYERCLGVYGGSVKRIGNANAGKMLLLTHHADWF